jgi:hypothetical protein
MSCLTAQLPLKVDGIISKQTAIDLKRVILSLPRKWHENGSYSNRVLGVHRGIRLGSSEGLREAKKRRLKC